MYRTLSSAFIPLLSFALALTVSGCVSVAKQESPSKPIINKPAMTKPVVAPVSIEKKAPERTSIDNALPVKTKVKAASKKPSKEIKTKLKDKQAKLEMKKSKEPDLTSVFAPLYKLAISKSDLDEVSAVGVKRIQESLNKLGYDVGKVDGKAGKSTTSGIKRFLTDFELPLVDLRPTGMLLKQLDAVNDNSSGESIISIIKKAQAALQKSGFSVGSSGITDEATRQAILDYQLKNDLIVDGRLTHQVLNKLKIK